MREPQPSPHQLPAAESERIFRERIVPIETARARSHTRPTAVFLVAQPGSGKSRVAQQIGATFDSQGGFVDLDSDRYKPFHPDYDALMVTDDQAMAAHIGFDGRRWARMMHDEVLSRGLNTVVQTTAGDPVMVAGDMRRYSDAGYVVAAAFLGVPEAMSQRGIVHRYYKQVQDRGHGRLTVPETAQRSYAAIPVLADLIDRDRVADQVAVFRRGSS